MNLNELMYFIIKFPVRVWLKFFIIFLNLIQIVLNNK